MDGQNRQNRKVREGTAMLHLVGLTTESMTKPICVDERIPRFSWKLISDHNGVMQKSYRIEIATKTGVVWDSGTVKSAQSLYIPYEGDALRPFTEYRWTVWIEDCGGDFAEASSMFETGRMNTLWQAKWICTQGKTDDDSREPTYHFKKTFSLKRKPVRARLYASALGCYVCYIGGVRIGDDYFAPGYTDYLRHVQYQAYDVTERIGDGENELLCELAGGWFTGRSGMSLKGNRYGKKRAILFEIRLEYADGTVETIFSDAKTLCSKDGPRRFAGFFDGEVYDANLEQAEDWSFQPSRLYKGRAPRIVPEFGDRTIWHDRLSPVSQTDTKGGVLYDFGKNFAGIVHLDLEAPAGTRIVVRHAELLASDGSLSTENLRTAKAQIIYICKNGPQSFEPLFTYMGFRYVQITGLKPAQIKGVHAYELYADTPLTGDFSCDNELINQLQRNIITTQKANFIDIPTDCPQRDERVGWTGDIAIYAGAACFNMNTARFLRKWLRDLRSEQDRALGNIPYVIPTGNLAWMRIAPSPIWGDACSIVPWSAYMASGDVRFLEDAYKSIKKWLRYMSRIMALLHPLNPKKRFLYYGFSWGDWVAPGTSMQEQIKRAKWLATEYLAYSAHILALAAGHLGKEKEAEKYSALEARIKKCFCDNYLDEKGHIRGGFQSAYAVALCYDVLPDAARKTALDDLEKDVVSRGYHLSTGFPGTLHLPFALLDNGRIDTAFRLLLQDSCPSWLYPVKCGATSVWERWDALREDGSLNTERVGSNNMVSFSHYAYGAVGQFLYERVGGLVAREAGYRRFTIRPYIGGGIGHARISLETPYGGICSEWDIQDDGKFTLTVDAPANTRGTVVLPTGERREVGSGETVFTCSTGAAAN
jgi:alpha-L-rhamnosidase